MTTGPRRIYDQPISNFPSETWLRELADQEHEHDPIDTRVDARAEVETTSPRKTAAGTDSRARRVAADSSPELGLVTEAAL